MPVPFISVVSEDHESLESIQKGLQAVGYPARGYATLKTALQSSLSAPPALLIFDLALNQAQFDKLLAFIRLQDRLQRIPLIVLARTAHRLSEWRPHDDCLAVVAKPITLGELVEQIRRLLLEASRSQIEIRKVAQETARLGLSLKSHPHRAVAPESVPESARVCAPILPPRIHSATALWLEEELEIIANGCHFLSSQEIQGALGVNHGGSTQLVVDGVALPTAFFSSTQLKARLPASQLAERRQCTLQATHPVPCTGSTPGMVIHLPPKPEGHPLSPKPASASSPAGRPELAAAMLPSESAPRIDRLEPPGLAQIATHTIPDQASLNIKIHGQAFPEDAVAYLDGTPLNTEFVSAACLQAQIPPTLATREREFAVTVSYSRDRGLRLTNRCRFRVAADTRFSSPPAASPPALEPESTQTEELAFPGSSGASRVNQATKRFP